MSVGPPISPDPNTTLPPAWSFGERVTETVNRRHELFRGHALRIPLEPAVIGDAEVVSYGELEHSSNQWANYLRDLGVGADVAVALALDRCVELPALYLGILKAGGAVFPMDPDTPAQRREAQLEAVSPRVVITGGTSTEPWTAGAWTVLRLDEGADGARAYPVDAPEVPTSADQLAFLLATSGSSGSPRIVRWPVGFRTDEPVTSTGEVHLWKNDSGTTFTVAEVTRPLLRGGTLVVAPRGAERDPRRLAEVVARHGVTHLLTTPSQLQSLLQIDDPAAWRSVTHVDVSGERLAPTIRQRFFERMSARLTNAYGCTEAPGAASHVCSPDDDPLDSHVGRPAPGMEIFVLDPDGRPCPEGIRGEIFIGGRLSAGYLGDPDATAERFVAHPFDATPGARLFATGDTGEWLSGGLLQVIGRRDRQAKVLGFRVEPGDIEAALLDHEAVLECAVTVHTSETSATRLVAHVAFTGDGLEPTVSELRRFLRTRLPAHMVPGLIVPMEALPRTGSGKIDRRGLAGPGAPASGRAFEPPVTPDEVLLAEIWCTVLGVARVGRTDNFFEIGGNSLLALEVVVEVERRAGRTVDQRELFFQTLAQLAVRLEPR